MGAACSATVASADLHAVFHCRQIAGDNGVVRVQPGLNFDIGAHLRAQTHQTEVSNAVLIDHEHPGHSGAIDHGALRHAQLRRAADGKAHAHEAATVQPGVGRQVDLHRVGMAHRVGHRHGLGDGALQRFAVCQHLHLVAHLDLGEHLTRHLRRHLQLALPFNHQHRAARRGQVTLVGHLLHHHTGNRRGHGGIPHLRGSGVVTGLGRSHLLLRHLIAQLHLIPLLLRDRLFLVKIAEALEITLGVGQIGLRLRQPCAGLRHLALNVGGIDLEQQLPGLHRLPFFDIEGADIAHQPRGDLHLIARHHRARQQGEVLLIARSELEGLRRHHAGCGGGLRSLGGMAAGRQQGRGQHEGQRRAAQQRQDRMIHGGHERKIRFGCTSENDRLRTGTAPRRSRSRVGRGDSRNSLRRRELRQRLDRLRSVERQIADG